MIQENNKRNNEQKINSLQQECKKFFELLRNCIKSVLTCNIHKQKLMYKSHKIIKICLWAFKSYRNEINENWHLWGNFFSWATPCSFSKVIFILSNFS